MSLESIVRQFQSRLGDFAGMNARVAFDLGDDGVIAVDATANPPAIFHEEGEAGCIIRITAGNLEKLIDGSLDPMLAFTLGKLKINGSMGVAMKVAALLGD